MFPTSRHCRSQTFLALFDECMFTTERSRPTRPVHPRRQPGD
jgi:hypothetical protein